MEKYQIFATLDSKTCGICGGYDGEVYETDKAVVGSNMPPFHCFCRCTDVPYYDDIDMSDQTRAARDPETGKTYEVPADMSYKEWHEKYIRGGLSAGDKSHGGIPAHDKPVKLNSVDFSDKKVVLSKMKEYEDVAGRGVCFRKYFFKQPPHCRD